MGSLKSDFDRHNLHDVPSYQKIFDKIRSFEPTDVRQNWIQPALYLMVLTGARITELTLLKKKDAKFIGFDNRELYGEFTFADVASIQFNLFTEKNRKNKYRIVPVVKNDFFLEPLESIYNYWKTLEYDESYFFYRTRQSMWLAVKNALGKNYYPHLMRHISVTNDTKAGISPSILKSKFGWTDLRPHSIYSHLNWFDIQTAQEGAFGKPVKVPSVTEITVPENYPGEMAQMTELMQKVEMATWKGEKYETRKFNSLEEAIKNGVKTGDSVNGKLVVVCSTQYEVNECKQTLDGNKFLIVYAKSPERVKKFFKTVDKNSGWTKYKGGFKKDRVAAPTQKQIQNSGISVV